MSTETRLKVLTAVSLIALAGLAVLFYMFLPEQADEVMRRESEIHLEQVGERFVEDLYVLGDATALKLVQLKKDTLVQELVVQDEENVNALAADVDLAGKLCKKYGLAELFIIDNNAVVRSAFPEAARVGLKDLKALEQARQAAQSPSFIRLKTKQQEERYFKIMLSEPLVGDEIFLLTSVFVTKENLEDLAAKKSTVLLEVASGEAEINTDATDLKIVVVKGRDGLRVASIALGSVGDSGKVIRILLVKSIVILAMPWVLFFALVILWLGWPARKKEK